MSDDSTTQCLLFPGIFRKPVVAQFDQREGSSDGGALLLKAADRHYDLVAGLASCLRDERQAGKLDHSLRELVGQSRTRLVRWSANADIAMPPNLIVSTPEYRARADRLASQVHVAIILVPNLLCCPLFERTYNACGTSSSYIL